MSLKLHSRGENRNSCLLCLFFELVFFKFSTSVSGETSRRTKAPEQPEEPEDAAAAGISARQVAETDCDGTPLTRQKRPTQSVQAQYFPV